MGALFSFLFGSKTSDPSSNTKSDHVPQDGNAVDPIIMIIDKLEYTPIEMPQDAFARLAFGCILGAMCGDAIGVPVEFQNEVGLKKAEKCLELPGGGPFGLGKGQVTDDSELALCLAEGLVRGGRVLDIEKIAEMYHQWYLSPPFDIGITTRTAFKNAKTVAPGNHARTIRESALRSVTSQSNGGLMRITPLCVWTSKLTKEEIIQAVREEARLTHSNPTAQNVAIAYVYTINHLLNFPGEYKQAYEKCKDLVTEDLRDSDIEDWLRELENGVLPPPNDKMGWVKIAFLYSLHYLRKNTGYKEAMLDMVSQGGDTDTNCCIVGGMIGALHGLDDKKGVSEDLITKLLSFNASKDGGIIRHDYLVPGKVAQNLINKIIEIRPKSLKLQGGLTKDEPVPHL